MELKLIKIENPNNLNFILGQSHFIKTLEDVHELMLNCIPNAKFGLAFCEASQDRLITSTGTDPELIDLAKKNAQNLSAGHAFILFLKDCYPINILPRLKQIPEIVTLFCATANPTEVILAESEQGRGILGVIDGGKSTRFENDEDVVSRKKLLRNFGYKF